MIFLLQQMLARPQDQNLSNLSQSLPINFNEPSTSHPPSYVSEPPITPLMQYKPLISNQSTIPMSRPEFKSFDDLCITQLKPQASNQHHSPQAQLFADSDYFTQDSFHHSQSIGQNSSNRFLNSILANYPGISSHSNHQFRSQSQFAIPESTREYQGAFRKPSDPGFRSRSPLDKNKEFNNFFGLLSEKLDLNESQRNTLSNILKEKECLNDSLNSGRQNRNLIEEVLRHLGSSVSSSNTEPGLHIPFQVKQEIYDSLSQRPYATQLNRSNQPVNISSRSEVKKCRRVYGLARKDQWCNQCKWKKACKRFPERIRNSSTSTSLPINSNIQPIIRNFGLTQNYFIQNQNPCLFDNQQIRLPTVSSPCNITGSHLVAMANAMVAHSSTINHQTPIEIQNAPEDQQNFPRSFCVNNKEKNDDSRLMM